MTQPALKPTYTALLISQAAKHIPGCELKTLHGMATGSVGTIEYDGELYEVRVVPAEYGVEKWSHPKE